MTDFATAPGEPIHSLRGPVLPCVGRLIIIAIPDGIVTVLLRFSPFLVGYEADRLLVFVRSENPGCPAHLVDARQTLVVML